MPGKQQVSFTPCFARAALLLVSGKWNGAMVVGAGFWDRFLCYPGSSLCYSHEASGYSTLVWQRAFFRQPRVEPAADRQAVPCFGDCLRRMMPVHSGSRLATGMVWHGQTSTVRPALLVRGHSLFQRFVCFTRVFGSQPSVFGSERRLTELYEEGQAAASQFGQNVRGTHEIWA